MAQCGTVSRVWRHTAVHIAAATRGGAGPKSPDAERLPLPARVDNTVRGPVKELLLLHTVSVPRPFSRVVSRTVRGGRAVRC